MSLRQSRFLRLRLRLRAPLLLAPLLLAPLLLALGTARADEPPATPAMERAKQDLIYRSRGAERPEGYIIDRTLLMYFLALGDDFKHSLAALGPTDRWLDIGAGEGRAIVDYAVGRYDVVHGQGGDPGGKGLAVAISIEDRRTPIWHDAETELGPGRIQYLFGKPLRQYSRDGLGRFQLISDVMGGFSYAEELSLFMEKTLDLLQVGGSFYGVLLDVHSEREENPPHYAGSPYRTHIADAQGKEVKICGWLKRIGCAEVSCEFRNDWEPPIELYRVRKVCEQTAVPALLQVRYEAGTPPERGYQLLGEAESARAEPAAPAVSAPTTATVRTVSEPR